MFCAANESNPAFHAAHAACYVTGLPYHRDFPFLYSDAAIQHPDGRIRSAARALREGPETLHPDNAMRTAAHAARAVQCGGLKAEREEHREQADLLRCIFGNPFRPVLIEPSWLAWNDGTSRKMASAIYDDRAFDRLPLVADALEEAGCNNAGLLAHCRQPGRHVRGCWVVDLLLGKS